MFFRREKDFNRLDVGFRNSSVIGSAGLFANEKSLLQGGFSLSCSRFAADVEDFVAVLVLDNHSGLVHVQQAQPLIGNFAHFAGFAVRRTEKGVFVAADKHQVFVILAGAVGASELFINQGSDHQRLWMARVVGKGAGDVPFGSLEVALRIGDGGQRGVFVAVAVIVFAFDPAVGGFAVGVALEKGARA